jgi:hypothetical protein
MYVGELAISMQQSLVVYHCTFWLVHACGSCCDDGTAFFLGMCDG